MMAREVIGTVCWGQVALNVPISSVMFGPFDSLLHEVSARNKADVAIPVFNSAEFKLDIGKVFFAYSLSAFRQPLRRRKCRPDKTAARSGHHLHQF